jgi:hypothetical protein
MKEQDRKERRTAALKKGETKLTRLKPGIHEKYTTVCLRLPLEKKEILEAYAEDASYSLNAYLNHSLDCVIHAVEQKRKKKGNTSRPRNGK